MKKGFYCFENKKRVEDFSSNRYHSRRYFDIVAAPTRPNKQSKDIMLAIALDVSADRKIL